ncbi:hypothetical protein HMN09_01186900 [Mycena chlorophos]|uniref:Uncharacterized protein n=1 Tax=Mycena chlorophos TaxID=658473 RepID=A0A8H6S8T9_MYCCL|nr:hypothetical protein HMN09_01186900 [Mycena chlorophos]
MCPIWPRTLTISISTSISASASSTASSDILPSPSALSPNAALPVPTAVDGTESHFAVVALATVLGLILLSIAIFFVGRQIGVSLFIGQHEFGRERIGLRNVRLWELKHRAEGHGARGGARIDIGMRRDSEDQQKTKRSASRERRVASEFNGSTIAVRMGLLPEPPAYDS